MKRIICFHFVLITLSCSCFAQNPLTDGYKGIWFTLGQFSEYGDKYSGGLGTYTANHIPLAIYSKEAGKTFFTYGGTSGRGDRHLLIMISYYDHRTRKVPRPVIVYDKQGVDDPHDNASIAIDEKGYILVFVSGRGKTRPGLIFRSSRPYSIDGFDRIYEGEMTYPQAWLIPDKGFIFMFTKYTKGRELYWDTGPYGISGVPASKLAGMGGHYQVTAAHGTKLVSVFNYHPGGNVDRRTNLYAVQTSDLGRTWTSVGGKELSLPLTGIANDALVRDYESENKLVYINDLNFDTDGNPVILAVISRDFRPGPGGDPREWTVIRWKDGGWHFTKVCESTHNYDMGSLYTGKEDWIIIGPTEPGPQKYGTGGEIAIWKSSDSGISWRREALLTSGSQRNHSYVRRPLYAHDDFYAFWADGHADEFSESHLYFTNRHGDMVWELPYVMNEDFASPVLRFINGKTVE